MHHTAEPKFISNAMTSLYAPHGLLTNASYPLKLPTSLSFLAVCSSQISSSMIFWEILLTSFLERLKMKGETIEERGWVMIYT